MAETARVPDSVPETRRAAFGQAVARLQQGIERGPNESLAEMIARAMGISVRELRAEFQRRAGYT